MQSLPWLIALCEMVGTFCGLYAAYRTTKVLSKSRWSRSIKRPQTISRVAALIAGAVSAPFVWFLAFSVGGTLGGGYGASLSSEMGVLVIIPVGIGFAIFLVVWLGIAAASCSAFALVRTVEQLFAN